jgi:hypothetical protein
MNKREKVGCIMNNREKVAPLGSREKKLGATMNTRNKVAPLGSREEKLGAGTRDPNQRGSTLLFLHRVSPLSREQTQQKTEPESMPKELMEKKASAQWRGH